MKTKYFLLLFALCFQMIANAQEIEQPQVVAVVKIDRVYILMDETPVTNLQVGLRDETGKIILEHSFNNETKLGYFYAPGQKRANTMLRLKASPSPVSAAKRLLQLGCCKANSTCYTRNKVVCECSLVLSPTVRC
ncbi:MAG: hypothetical protein IPL65_18675 [Lewinellaceae bacterium]|nr:hypothetical protein [Lewinellaceae bacterium]